MRLDLVLEIIIIIGKLTKRSMQRSKSAVYYLSLVFRMLWLGLNILRPRLWSPGVFFSALRGHNLTRRLSFINDNNNKTEQNTSLIRLEDYLWDMLQLLNSRLSFNTCLFYIVYTYVG